MPRIQQGRTGRLRSAFNADRGSMPLALFLVIFILAAAATIASSVTWQIANNRNEIQQRNATWGLESAANRAAQTVGATGRFLRGIPTETPGNWTLSEDESYVYRWWADPITAAGPTEVSVAPRLLHTASDGSTLLGLGADNKIYISTDSTTWVPVGNSPLQTPGDVAQVTYEHGYFYIVPVPNGKTIALSNGNTMRPVYRSANGVDWSSLGSPGQVTHADKPQTAALDCSNGACIYIATVLDETTLRPTSTRYFAHKAGGWDLVADTDAGSGVALALDIAYGNGTWVTIGANQFNQATVSVSNDNGTSWSSANVYASGSTSGTNIYPTQLEHVGTRFISLNTSTYTLGAAEAATDSAWTSENGVDWSQSQISATPQYWQDITARADGSMVAAVPGQAGHPANSVYLSATGAGWIAEDIENGAYSSLTPIGPSWLLQGTSTDYAVPSNPEVAGLPDRINVNVQVLPVGLNGSYDSQSQTPYQSTAVYEWSPVVSSWQISAYFNQTTVIPTTTVGDTIPTNLALTINGPQSAYLTWTAPASFSSPITGYRIQYDVTGTFTDDPRTFDTSNTTTGFAFSNLVPATRYYVRVAALSNASVGSYSAVVGEYSNYVSGVTTTSAPLAPLSLTATTPDAFSADLTWTAPTSDGGSAISGWSIQYSLDSTFETGVETITSTDITHRTYHVSGLTGRKTYYFRVAGINSVGVGDYSPNADAAVWMPPTPPTAPLNLDATANLALPGVNTSVSLTWDAPASDGSADIDDYIIEYRVHGTSTWNIFTDGTGTNLYAYVTNLEKGTSYDFQVTARNSDAGNGPASASATITTDTSTPGAPSNVIATPGDAFPNQTTSMDLTWDAPADNGGLALLDYTIEYRVSGTGLWSTWSNSLSTATSSTITGLTKGVTYQFRVAALNSKGTGTASGTISETTMVSVPGTVRSLTSEAGTATPGSQTSMLVMWVAPVDNGGSTITDYVIEYRKATSSTWLTFADGTNSATFANVTGLDKGTSYVFRVKASNSEGSGATVQITRSTLTSEPAAPDNFTVTAGAASAGTATTSANLSWSTPADNGGVAITDYVIEYKPANDSTWNVYNDGLGTSDVTTISGLSKGASYNFRVKAVNSVGSSEYSSTATLMMGTSNPDPVTGLTATPGTATAGQTTNVSLTWSAPQDNGGVVIVDYTVQYKQTADSTWTTFPDGLSTSTSATVTGLLKGTSYDFRVSAVNSVGLSDPSDATTTTGTSAPTAPTNLSLTADTASAGATTSITATWSSPNDNGGSAVTGYKVYVGGSLVTTTAATTFSYSATGLTKGTLYTIEVSAANAPNGEGAKASASTTTNSSAPAAPTGLTVTSNTSSVGTLASGVVALSWSASTDTGGANRSIANYYIYRDGVQVGQTSGATTYTDSSLNKGQSYTWTVSAYNSYLESAQSSSTSATPPVTAPSAFTTTNSGQAFTAVSIVGYNSTYFSGSSPATWSIINGGGKMYRNSGTIDLAWGAPADPGGVGQTVTYTVTGPSGTVLSNSSALSLTGTAVPDANTTYTWTVTAKNTAGLTVTSSTSKAIPAGPANVTLNSANPMNWTITTNGISGSGAAFYRWNGSSACGAAHVSSERMGFSTMPANNNWSMNTNGYTSPYYRVLIETGSYLSVVTGCKLG